MKTEIFNFEIPEGSMPREPNHFRNKNRDDCKLITLCRKSQKIIHQQFKDIVDYLNDGDCLVINDSFMLFNVLEGAFNEEKVKIYVRGFTEEGALIELKSTKKINPGDVIMLIKEDIYFTILQADIQNTWNSAVSQFDKLIAVLAEKGGRDDVIMDADKFCKDPTQFRAVYANKPGSLEPASAGLHFTSEILNKLIIKGVQIVPITLHVASTEILAIRHITSENIESHKVNSEYYEISANAANIINSTRAKGKLIFAVGTTAIRALVTTTTIENSKVITSAQTGWTDLYIYPGYKYKSFDMMLTNLHQPKSSHIVLTAAFAGVDLTMKAYNELVEQNYEFDMFGDCMLIV